MKLSLSSYRALRMDVFAKVWDIMADPQNQYVVKGARFCIAREGFLRPDGTKICELADGSLLDIDPKWIEIYCPVERPLALVAPDGFIETHQVLSFNLPVQLR